jgi:anti-sigma factor ChrR (cupin superfamily)
VPGVTYKVLFVDKAAGLVTTLVRMEPGASIPAHRHSRAEQCLVLEGDLIHDDHVYGPGDFTWAEAGSIDPALQTKRGNLLLIIGPPETEKV